ncbi:hypothetical protein KAR48_18665 [bacterium]|nr:hypothetical protein [bacterium]
MKKLKMRFAAALLLALMFLAVFPAAAQIRIKIKPFAGFGYGRVITDYAHQFAVDDTLDEHYFDFNLATVPRGRTRGQSRIDLLQIYDVTLGYLFWSHSVKFTHIAPDNILKTKKVYPRGVQYNMHGATLTWYMPYKGIGSRSRLPFIMGGAGRYYGAKKGTYYIVNAETNLAEGINTTMISYDDWGYFVGVGLIVHKYFYVYAGMTELMGDGLMGSRFFDIVIGFTF